MDAGEIIAGRYEVVRQLGSDAGGNLYEVSHCNLRRRFALKTLAPHLRANPDAIAALKREIALVSGLRHPNIVDIVDVGALPDGTPWTVMEWLTGEDLWSRLAHGGPMRWGDIRRFGDQVLSGLATVHAAGVAHGGLSPRAIFVHADDGGVEHAVLLDVGVSCIRRNSSEAMWTRLLDSSPYSAPEQLTSDSTAPAADVWSMGAILYEMATGEEPWRDDDAELPPPDVGQLRPDAPPKFAEVLQRAMARDPSHRFATASQFRADLRRALAPQYLDELKEERQMSSETGSTTNANHLFEHKTMVVHGAVPIPSKLAQDALAARQDEAGPQRLSQLRTRQMRARGGFLHSHRVGLVVVAFAVLAALIAFSLLANDVDQIDIESSTGTALLE